MKKVSFLHFILFCLWISLFKIFLIPDIIQKGFKLITITLCFAFFIKHFEDVKKQNFILYLWCAWIMISSFLSFYNKTLSFDNFINSILYSVCLSFTYFVINYCFSIKKMKVVIDTLYITLFVYSIMSILSIIILGYNDVHEVVYFAGNKFRTGYYFTMFLCIWYFKNYELEKKKLKINFMYILLLGLFLFLDLYIKCTTVFLGTLIMGGVFLLSKNFAKLNYLLKKPLFVVSLISIFGYLPFVMEKLLLNRYVSKFIINVLGESATLTGRLKIYGSLMKVLKERLWLGYGYGNDIVSKTIGYGNAQNGLLFIFISYGIIGMILFLLTIYKMLTIKRKRELIITQGKYNIFYAYTYFIIICSIVETSFNYMFYVILFIIAIANLYENTEEQNEKRIQG